MKKLLSLVLACLMVMGVLAGCGSSNAPAESKAPEAPAKNETPAETAAPEVKEDPVEIIWFIRSDEPQNYESVMAAFNEKALADINMTLDLRFISPGDYNDKMQMAMAGGDEWDLCFTSHWANNYVNAAGKGAYLELTEEMLNQYAPDVMATIPEQLWDGIRINGKLYGMMNYQVMYDQPGIWFDKEAIDEQNIDLTTIKDWDSLNAVLDTLAKAYPDKYANRGNGASNANFFAEEPNSCIMGYLWLYYNPETKMIENDTFFEKNAAFFENSKLWKDNGWCPPDAATMKDENTMITNRQILSRYSRQKPGNTVALENTYGHGFYDIATGPAVIDTNAAQSTVTAVNINSEHPEKAIQMFNYVFGNKEAANILFWGLEGQDYELVDGRVQKLENAWTVPQWEMGNQFNAMLTVNDVEGVWEETMKGNAEAYVDVLFGFVPNREPIETELATCEAIWGEYKDILAWGLRDWHEALPEMLDKMEKAGLSTVTAELQAQVDAFLAAK